MHTAELLLWVTAVCSVTAQRTTQKSFANDTQTSGPAYLWPLVGANGDAFQTSPEGRFWVHGVTSLSLGNQEYRSSPQCSSEYQSYLERNPPESTYIIADDVLTYTRYIPDIGCCFHCEFDLLPDEIFFWPLDEYPGGGGEEGRVRVATAADNSTYTITHPYMYAKFTPVSGYDACGMRVEDLSVPLFSFHATDVPTKTNTGWDYIADEFRSSLYHMTPGEPARCMDFYNMLGRCDHDAVISLFRKSIQALHPSLSGCIMYPPSTFPAGATNLDAQEALLYVNPPDFRTMMAGAQVTAEQPAKTVAAQPISRVSELLAATANPKPVAAEASSDTPQNNGSEQDGNTPVASRTLAAEGHSVQDSSSVQPKETQVVVSPSAQVEETPVVTSSSPQSQEAPIVAAPLPEPEEAPEPPKDSESEVQDPSPFSPLSINDPPQAPPNNNRPAAAPLASGTEKDPVSSGLTNPSVAQGTLTSGSERVGTTSDDASQQEPDIAAQDSAGTSGRIVTVPSAAVASVPSETAQGSPESSPEGSAGDSAGAGDSAEESAEDSAVQSTEDSAGGSGMFFTLPSAARVSVPSESGAAIRTGSPEDGSVEEARPISSGQRDIGDYIWAGLTDTPGSSPTASATGTGSEENTHGGTTDLATTTGTDGTVMIVPDGGGKIERSISMLIIGIGVALCFAEML